MKILILESLSGFDAKKYGEQNSDMQRGNLNREFYWSADDEFYSRLGI